MTSIICFRRPRKWPCKEWCIHFRMVFLEGFVLPEKDVYFNCCKGWSFEVRGSELWVVKWLMTRQNILYCKKYIFFKKYSYVLWIFHNIAKKKFRNILLYKYICINIYLYLYIYLFYIYLFSSIMSYLLDIFKIYIYFQYKYIYPKYVYMHLSKMYF